MFRWQKGLEKLDIQASFVLDIERSLSDVQLAHPGFPSQMATAYLCIFSSGKGIRAAVALHLKVSHQVVYYLNEEGEVPQNHAARLAEGGRQFAESMGFLLTEFDFAKRDPRSREKIWDSLPLKTKPRTAPIQPPRTQAASSVPSAAVGEQASKQVPLEEAVNEPTGGSSQGAPPAPATIVVEPSVSMPPPADPELLRKRFLEKLGRFLGSL